MIPVTVYLHTPEASEPYRQLFRQQFYEIPALGSTVRVFVTDRMDVYVVREVYHDFRSGPQGPSALPISVVVEMPNGDESPEASGRAPARVSNEWGADFQGHGAPIPSLRPD